MGTPRTGNTVDARVGLDDYWYLRAACRGNWHLFDAEESVDGGSKQHYPHLTEAREICSVCPVFNQCRQDGKDELTGIWAGEPKGV